MRRVRFIALPPVPWGFPLGTPTFSGMAERYATPLPKITDEVAALAARDEEYLKRMGTPWK